MNLRSQKAIALFEQFKYDPLEKQIKLAKSLEGAILRADPSERLEYRKLMAMVNNTLLRHAYPTLKAVEHTGEVTHLHHTIEELESLSDAELQAYVVMLRHERLLDAEDGG